MTLRTLIDNVSGINGAVVVKEYCAETDRYVVYAESDTGMNAKKLPERALDMDVTYLYCEDEALVIEIA